MTRLTQRIKTNLKEARESAGFTQEKLAQVSGVSWSTIARIEQGRTSRPRDTELAKIAAALHTTPDALMGFGDDPDNDADPDLPDSFHHELARRYGPENAAFVDTAARIIQGFPPREAAFARNLLIGALHGARSPWRNSPDGETEIVDLVSPSFPTGT
jgi:transcriptional regulator with XRE-family HTH domain